MSEKQLWGYAVAAATLVIAAITLYKFAKDEVAAGAQAVGNAVNPTSDTNLAYRGVNAVGEALTGDASFSLGSWLYDRFNPPYDPNAVYEPRQTSVRKEAIVAAQVSEYL